MLSGLNKKLKRLYDLGIDYDFKVSGIKDEKQNTIKSEEGSSEDVTEKSAADSSEISLRKERKSLKVGKVKRENLKSVSVKRGRERVKRETSKKDAKKVTVCNTEGKSKKEKVEV
ncbi:unnamed protein product [Enterobius vermicularis]|uniref:Protein DEK-like n=1 Tax=Enterobius vermicularis TaxID=51028 RepID=A0A0N4V8E5_ENTVE|nr:unnamed protein product [Enterobius vermicularis]